MLTRCAISYSFNSLQNGGTLSDLDLYFETDSFISNTDMVIPGTWRVCDLAAVNGFIKG
jgi:hypothetical protein